jgi:hypothetical protein
LASRMAALTFLKTCGLLFNTDPISLCDRGYTEFPRRPLLKLSEKG